MAPLATALSADDGLTSKKLKVARRNLVKTKPATPYRHPRSYDVANNSESQLEKPFSEKARRSITKQTTRLMEWRSHLDQALLQESETRFQRLPPKDKRLGRRELRRLAKALVKEEKVYTSTMRKILREKERLRRQDPNKERAIDVDLVKTQLQRFERHLGSNLADRERPIESAENDSDTKGSSTISDTSSERPVVRKQPESNHTSESNETVEQEVAQTEVVEKEERDAQRPSQLGLDGAFDDDSRPKSKKRKHDDEQKERRKEARKARREQAREERANKDKQVSSAQASEAQSQQCKPISPAKSAKDAAIHNMSQSKKGKVDGAAEKKTGWSSVRVNGYSIQVPPAPSDLDSDDEELKYKKIARAMLTPEYNDHVHQVPRRGKPPPYKYPMSGALMDPEDDLVCNGALMTPPASDEADNADGQARKRRAARKKRTWPQKRASPMTPSRGNKLRRNKNKYRSTVGAPY